MLGDSPRHRTYTMAHRCAPRIAAVATSAVVSALTLAGCGISSGSVTYGPGAGSTTTPGTGHTGGTSIRPCSGPWASVNVAGTPALVLTLQTPSKSGAAQVGDLVQVRLPITNHWSI